MTKQQHHYRSHGHRPKRQWGISLVPVMISIAIFTALAVQYTLPKQQQQLRNQMVNNAQISATQILQAAMAYQVEEGNWPGNTNALTSTPVYLPIVNKNPWGNGWAFSAPAGAGGGLVLATQAGDNQAAIALAARFGAIARVCRGGNELCDNPDLDGTWVYIGIAPP